MTVFHNDASQTRQGDPFAYLHAHKYVQLTTYRKTGVGVSALVWFAHQAGKVYVMTPGTAGKLKRIRNNGRATLAPGTFFGKVVGASIDGHARIMIPEEQEIAHRALARKYGLTYRIATRMYRISRKQTTYIEIQPVQD